MKRKDNPLYNKLFNDLEKRFPDPIQRLDECMKIIIVYEKIMKLLTKANTGVSKQ